MRRIVILCLVAQTFGQWSSFSLSGLNLGDIKSEQLYRYGGLTTAHQPTMEIPNERRIALGATMNKGFSNSGMIPIIHGEIKVSWNLSLRGRVASYGASEGVVQLYGWGMSLTPGKEDEPSKWTVLLDAGRLNAHDELYLTGLQFMGKRFVEWKGIPIQIGLGLNKVDVNPFGIAGEDSPSKVKLQTNFLNVGTSFNLFGLKAIPQLCIGANYNLISISIMDTF